MDEQQEHEQEHEPVPDLDLLENRASQPEPPPNSSQVIPEQNEDIADEEMLECLASALEAIPCAAESEDEEPPLAEACNSDLAAAPPAVAPPAVAPPASSNNDENRPDDESGVREIANMPSSSWGPCRITAVKPRSSSGYGSFSARCVWHRLNDKTDCKKTFRLKGPWEDLTCREACVRRMLWWLSTAQQFARQRDHVWCPEIDDADIPHNNAIRQLRLESENAPKRGQVCTDVELDAMAIPISIMPPDSWHACREAAAAAANAAEPPAEPVAAAALADSTDTGPRNQPKAKVKARSKGRAKAKAKAQLEPPSPAALEQEAPASNSNHRSSSSSSDEASGSSSSSSSSSTTSSSSS